MFRNLSHLFPKLFRIFELNLASRKTKFERLFGIAIVRKKSRKTFEGEEELEPGLARGLLRGF